MRIIDWSSDVCSSELLVLTLVAVLGGAGGHAPLALIILLVAALGGFFLASFHLRKAPAPKPVVIVHAAVAVIGVVLLGCTAFGIACGRDAADRPRSEERRVGKEGASKFKYRW